MVFAQLNSPEFLTRLLAKDDQGGVLEIVTVFVLLPGIVAGAIAWFRWRNALPSSLSRGWLLFWVLACVYFAGEEISWGQWLFGWSTPEAMQVINDQNETNLHNISSWLDQKPRALVELWIVVAGLVLPVMRRLRQQSLPANSNAHWILPTFVCVPAGLVFIFVRLMDWVAVAALEPYSSSELREYSIAVFLALFLMSIATRAARAQRSA